MRSVRTLVLPAAVLLAALAFVPTAQADDCHYGSRYTAHRSGGGVTCNRSGTCYVRDRCHPSTRYVIPRHNHRLRVNAGGCSPTYVRRGYGPWSHMRRGLAVSRIDLRRSFISHYWLGRNRFCLTEGQTLEQHATLEALLMIGNEEMGSERALDAQGLLDRGTARFHVGDYEGAKMDFTALLGKNASEHRARLGLVMVGAIANDWKTANDALNTLAKAGELRADDRIAADVFAEKGKLKSITDAMISTASYRMTNAKAHTVTAYLLAGQGDSANAKRFVRLAERWGGSSPARTALAVNLGMRKAPVKTPPTKKGAEGTVNEKDALRPANPALHRQIAKVDKKPG